MVNFDKLFGYKFEDFIEKKKHIESDARYLTECKYTEPSECM